MNQKQKKHEWIVGKSLIFRINTRYMHGKLKCAEFSTYMYKIELHIHLCIALFMCFFFRHIKALTDTFF